LRRLFHVHSALAEFDLAMKAFDTYLDLVTNANRRAEQSGKRLGSLEDEETFIRTLSQGITLLCCYGSRKEAERANQLSGQLHEALSSLTEPDRTESLSESSVAPDEVYRSKHGTDVSVSVVSAAYQAVGVGLANWARWTPVNESRTAIQESAATAFEKSLEIDSDHGSNASTSFALGLLLAEMRDVDGAIDSVRSALIQTSETDDVPSTPLVTYSEGHNLLSLWHLLVLLLSARQEFELAEKVCETATSEVSIQQALRLPSVYEGSEDGRANALNMGVYDTKFRQKEILVELRMTQLAITEVLHGPEAALNRSDELFSLFAALFKGLGVTEKEETPKSERLAPPKTSSGKSRSFRGSIFSRRKNQQPGDRASHTTSSGSVKDRSSSGSHTAPDTPAIQVTKEEAGASDEPHSPETGDRTPQKLHRRQASLAKLVKEQSSAPSSALPSPARSQHVKDEPDIRSSTVGERVSPTAGHDVSPGARQALPPVPHNMKHTKEPFPAGHATQPPKQDIRLPPPSTHFQGPTNAVTLFPRLQARKHAQGLLIKVWLFISGLYRRASLFDDACEALHEASEQATRVELLVAEQESSARALAAAGWGGAKSSDELWADVFAEAGLLAEAQSQPYDAISQFEEALMYWPDHARATVGLANLLLSIYDETLSPERPETEADADISGSSPTSTLKPDKSPNEPPVSGSSQKETPEKLNRLAARDRAYGLLSALTKLGSAWDDSEAWFALSKAYERSGQVERAKEILWWCVELEDRRPVRHWWSINSGGYVL
jgi:tetratricopeptide (TPR) repeat protein